ncbi:hypothetical protein N008_00135 [Hymenobacter sp. APR13]|nr:hypothetical protein N008_00135 [Hymenobacter sp. APR13]
MQALEMGFRAVYKGSKDVGEELKKTLEIAKLPGLGLKEALQGATALQAAGFAAEESRKILLSFGNALATVGKGKAELDRVTLALTQINNTSNVMGQDLNQLKQALPQVGEVLQKAFGTTSAEGLRQLGITSKEFIATLTSEFGKLPQVTSGLKNTLENLSDTGVLALSKLGNTANKVLDLEAVAGRLGAKLEELATAFENLDPVTQKAIFVVAGLAAAAGPLLLALGAVGSAVSVVSTGLAVLGGPITLAIAGVAALAAGIAYLAATSGDSANEFKLQREQLNGVNAAAESLLKQYEALKSKTNKTKEEQAELNKVMERLNETVPGAADSWDSYGNILTINSARVRAFTEDNKALLKTVNAAEIAETRKKLSEAAEVYRNFYDQRKQIEKQGFVAVATLGDASGQGGELIKYGKNTKEYSDFIKRAGAAHEAVRGLTLQLNNLTGVQNANTGATKAAGAADDADTSKKKAKITTLKQLQDALKKALEVRFNEKDASKFAAEDAVIESLREQIKQFKQVGSAGSKAADDIKQAYDTLAKSLSKINADVKIKPKFEYDAAGERAKAFEAFRDSFIDAGGNQNNKSFIAAGVSYKTNIELSKQYQEELKKQKDAENLKTKQADFLKDIADNLERTNQEYAVLGSRYDILRERGSLLESGIKKATELFGLQSDEVTNLTNQLKANNAEVDRRKDVEVRYDVKLSGPVGVPDPVIKTTSATGEDLSAGTREQAKALREAATAYAEAKVEGEAYGVSLDTVSRQAENAYQRLSILKAEGVSPLSEAFIQAQADFDNAQFGVKAQQGLADMNSAIESGLATAAGNMSAGIANVISGAAPISSLGGILLGAVGDILIQLGKLAITTGVTVKAIKSAFTNPFTAVAAGVAAIALGTLVKGAATSILSGGGSSGTGAVANVGSSVGSGAGNVSAQQKQNLTLEVKFQPVELRADGPTLRSSMSVDEYRLGTKR